MKAFHGEELAMTGTRHSPFLNDDVFGIFLLAVCLKLQPVFTTGHDPVQHAVSAGQGNLLCGHRHPDIRIRCGTAWHITDFFDYLPRTVIHCRHIRPLCLGSRCKKEQAAYRCQTPNVQSPLPLNPNPDLSGIKHLRALTDNTFRQSDNPFGELS